MKRAVSGLSWYLPSLTPLTHACLLEHTGSRALGADDEPSRARMAVGTPSRRFRAGRSALPCSIDMI